MEKIAYSHIVRNKNGIPYIEYSAFPENEALDDAEKSKIFEVLFGNHSREIVKIGFKEEKSSYLLTSSAVILRFDTETGLDEESRVHLGVFATSTAIHYIIPIDMIEYIGSETGDEYYKRESMTR